MNHDGDLDTGSPEEETEPVTSPSVRHVSDFQEEAKVAEDGQK